MRHFLADAGGFRTTMEVLGMTAGMNTRPAIGLLRHGPRPRDHEEIPLGSLVRTPTGKEAEVRAYRGYGSRAGAGRAHRVYLVSRYLNPDNKRFNIVQLLPELVVVVRVGPERIAA
jgi:hypothetical protein